MQEQKRRLARILKEKSYREGDFVLASGRRSDYYFDCRVTALSAEGSWLIGSLFNDLLADLAIRGVGGMTLGADPLVTATTVISWERGRPLHGLIVRKEAIHLPGWDSSYTQDEVRDLIRAYGELGEEGLWSNI